MTRNHLLGALSAIALVGSLAPAVHAQTVATPYSWTSALTTGSSYFTRPFGLGLVNYYDYLTFIPDTTGDYTFDTTAASFQPSNYSDTYIYLYDGVFDPLNPLTNLINNDDDGSPLGLNLSRMTSTLTQGSSYTFVVSTYLPEETGSVTSQISGPGGANITLAGASSAPEPGSLVLLGLVALPALGLIRRRK